MAKRICEYDKVRMHLDDYGNQQRWRPTCVEAEIHLTSTKGRGNAPQAMALLNNPNSQLATKNNINADGLDRPLDTDYGHIVGLSLGGPDVSGNVAPVYAHINRIWMREIETGIWASKKMRASGYDLVQVDLTYADGTTSIPHKIKVSVLEKFSCKVIATFQRDNVEQSPRQVMNFTDFALELQTTLLPKGKELLKNGFKIQNEKGFDKIAVPDDSYAKPYAVLDALYFRGCLDTYLEKALNMQRTNAVIGPGQDFADWQRELIFWVNRIENNGWLKSDQPKDDKHKDLLGVPGDRGAQVDHMIGKTNRQGSNAFSNAQVVSEWYNTNKSSTAKITAQYEPAGIFGETKVLEGRTRSQQRRLDTEQKDDGGNNPVASNFAHTSASASAAQPAAPMNAGN